MSKLFLMLGYGDHTFSQSTVGPPFSAAHALIDIHHDINITPVKLVSEGPDVLCRILTPTITFAGPAPVHALAFDAEPAAVLPATLRATFQSSVCVEAVSG